MTKYDAVMHRGSGRNQLLEFSKLIASFFVVCIHVPFPGTFGKIVTCLARFAVPMFFAISGFFSYQVGCDKLEKRILHIVKLNLVAIGVQITWRLCATILYGGSISDWLGTLFVSRQDLWKWLVLNVNPFGGHLWYLTSIFICYVFLWGYIRSYGKLVVNYRPLYFLCLCLAGIHFLLGEFSSVLGLDIPYEIPRGAMFLGLPMFGMGIFLRQFGDRFLQRTGMATWKILGMLFLFAIVSFFERLWFGSVELYLGTVGIVVMLMLLSWKCPQFCKGPVGSLVSTFGSCSTVIYIVHIPVWEYYMGMWQLGLYQRLGEQEAMLRPLIVMGISLLIAAAVECCAGGSRRLKQ